MITKQFKTILEFELKNHFKNKVFLGVTIFIVAAITIVMFFPRIAAMFEDNEKNADDKRPVMLISAKSIDDMESIKEAFAASFVDYEVRVAKKGVDDLKKEITSGKAECAFAITSLNSYTYYVDNLSLDDQNTEIADTVLQNLYRMNFMVDSGISIERVGELFSMQINHETEKLGKDQQKNFFYAYIMIFALYLVILVYGQMVATNVATEKSSRAMELLITSAKPAAMMFGKIIASCLAGFIQLICVFGTAFVLFNVNKSYWNDSEIINSIFDMPLELLVYMLVFFVLGFFIYAFMYGAIGSTASKVEDIETSVMPITILIVGAFMVVMFSMSSGNIDNTLMKVFSYIPFTSPMAMFTRIVMSTVPIYEIIISVIILIGSVIGVGIFSAKMYRVGVLLYGTTPKIGSILKEIWKA